MAEQNKEIVVIDETTIKSMGIQRQDLTNK